MKYLRIESKKGEFWNGEEYKSISEIGKKDLLNLLDCVDDDFKVDSFEEELILDPAQKIVYKNVVQKFEDFLENKGQFDTEVEGLYQSAISKYSATVTQEEGAGSILKPLTEEED
jgi:hypothetical protein